MQTYTMQDEEVQMKVFEKLKIDANPHPLPQKIGRN
jgi:hypothetical protein